MLSILRPAARLASELKFGAKFFLIGSVFGLPLLIMASLLVADLFGDIKMIERERQGVVFNQALSDMLSLAQKHRGMTNGLLSGDASFEPAIRDNETALEMVVGKLTQINRDFGAGLGLQADMAGVLQEWQQLLGQWRSSDAKTNFSTHTVLIEKVLRSMLLVADRSGLTQDPEPESYYLQRLAYEDVMVVAERLALARGLGTGIASRKQITLDERVRLAATLGIARHMIATMRLQLEMAFGHAEPLKQAMGGQSEQLLTRIGTTLQTIEQQLVQPETITVDPKAYFAETTIAVEEAYQLLGALGGQLNLLLDRRAVAARSTAGWHIAFGVLLLTVSVWLFLGTYRSLQGAVGELGRVSTALSAGDLTVAARIGGRDELQQIGTAFNAMVVSWRELISKLSQSAEHVSQAAAELTSNAEQIASSSLQQSNAAASMASSVQQMSVSIAQVADNTADADKQAAASQQQSVQMHQVVTGAVDEIVQIEQSVNETAQMVNALGASATEISNIVGVIKDIADQTNLLALNAAIESARAGEAGRGFAVVADEVRTLAARTTEATQQISMMIQGVQDKTYRAVTAMRQGHERVGNGVQLVKHAGESVQGIRATISKAKEMINDIASSATEQRQASTQIAQNVERVAQMAEQNAAAVQNALYVSQRLQTEASDLSQSLAVFRL
ncbi:methyl-accepting chemotaxis protein [Chitinivorax sp. B]|uniref:methyl-accepting chemotaxis protein n=1 Tax=Chitinivorax sp. B TaxID=2502235 RepID=UPI001484CE84|nr:methyl-accepting chemotaxis protein [Chitinivorax sp. B]